MSTYQELGYDKVCVALDGTEAQQKVLERAIVVAANNNAELYVGYVIDSTALETAGFFPDELLKNLERDFRASIDELIKQAEAAEGIKKVEVIVKSGRIRETLKEDMLDVIEPDLIICGARGLSSIKYALLGSISTFLTRNAKCDTLVLK